MRVLLVIAAAAGAILVFLLASASANTRLFAEHYAWLLGANALIAVAMAALVAIRLQRLWRDYRAGLFGSRLKSRLMLMLALMAVLPGALVYAVSMQFAVRSIDSWFDVRVDAALEGGIELGRSVLESQQAELLDKAQSMALELGEPTAVGVARLNRLREQGGLQSATLFAASGQILVSSSAEVGDLMPALPSPAQLRLARQGRAQTYVDGDDASGLIVRVLVPATGLALGAEPRVLQLTQAVPASIVKSAESVAAAHRDYQELQLGKEGLKRIYTLTLTLTLLLALFAAIGLAFLAAERLARPLLILAEGTQAVAAGDFTPKAEVRTTDELGVLTQSFSRMTRQLDEARRETERSRAYLESVLANLSAGVLTFDADFRLRAANLGATAILRDSLDGLRDMALTGWPRHGQFATAIRDSFAELGGEWQRELELEAPGGVPQTLLVRGSTLPEATGAGYVVVFDDITQLISAQRTAAWGEVARRLAHEIKNPLTPIQLSAERLQMKLGAELSAKGRDMLDRSIGTIVSQVEAMKNMVNDFRDYARTPPPTLASVDLNGLIGEVLALYESGPVRVASQLAEPLPPVRADASQLRQVLHNLVKNAAEALAEHPPADGGAPRVCVATRAEADGVVFTVADNGTGFTPQILARAFEPYVTTKAKGTGLGLAIVKKIIDEHHGEIELANREAGGAEVLVKLPAVA